MGTQLLPPRKRAISAPTFRPNTLARISAGPHFTHNQCCRLGNARRADLVAILPDNCHPSCYVCGYNNVVSLRQHDGLNVRRIDFRSRSTMTWTTVFTTCLRPSMMTRQTAATELSNKEKIATAATPRLWSDNAHHHHRHQHYHHKT